MFPFWFHGNIWTLYGLQSGICEGLKSIMTRAGSARFVFCWKISSCLFLLPYLLLPVVVVVVVAAAAAAVVVVEAGWHNHDSWFQHFVWIQLSATATRMAPSKIGSQGERDWVAWGSPCPVVLVAVGCNAWDRNRAFCLRALSRFVWVAIASTFRWLRQFWFQVALLFLAWCCVSKVTRASFSEMLFSTGLQSFWSRHTGFVVMLSNHDEFVVKTGPVCFGFALNNKRLTELMTITTMTITMTMTMTMTTSLL